MNLRWESVLLLLTKLSCTCWWWGRIGTFTIWQTTSWQAVFHFTCPIKSWPQSIRISKQAWTELGQAQMPSKTLNMNQFFYITNFVLTITIPDNTKPYQIEPNHVRTRHTKPHETISTQTMQTKPNHTKPEHTKPHQTIPNHSRG